MSYATGTTHYNLPQTVGTDKRDWTDTNQAFADVDAALYQAQQDASGAASDVSAVDTRVTTLEGKMSTAEGKISILEASDTTQDTAILNLQNRVTAIESKDIEVTFTDGTVGVFISTIGALTAGTYLIEGMDGTIVVNGQGNVLASARLGDANGNISLYDIRNTSGNVFGRVDFNTSASNTTYHNYTGTQADAVNTPFGTTIRLYKIH